MIATSIDGSTPSSNPLTDLLKVVANPAAYAEKIQQLEEATAQYEKMVSLAGPASDILALREKADVDRKEAKDALAVAKAKAAALTRAAEDKAAEILKQAETHAAKLRADAEAFVQSAKDTDAAAQAALAQARALEADAGKRAKAADKLAATLKAEIADAKKAKTAAETERDNIIAKHRAFLESI